MTRCGKWIVGVVVALAFGLRLSSMPAAAQAKAPNLQLHRVKLDNGLRVILVVDHTAPVVAIDVCYNVGSRNERPGRTGFAHLFEHMMFGGSANVGEGEYYSVIFNNGGTMNGTTNDDRTTYFEELPKNQVDLGLFLESDRMRGLIITQQKLDALRKAVEEERRQGVDNEPYGRAGIDLDNLSYDNFAYKHSTIGSLRDLNAASVQDVGDFFRIYYAPDNAVLTMVGDFNPDDVLAKVKKYFASIPSQPVPPSVDLTEEPHYGERSETIYDPLARQPEIDLSYPAPPGNTPGDYAIDELSIILGQGHSSRLYQHLVEEKQLASDVSTYTDMTIGPGRLYISANPRPGVKVEDLQKGINEEIAAIVDKGATSAELAKAKTQLLRQFIEHRRSDLFTAILIGDDAVKFNDPNLINTMLNKENEVTLDELNAAAKKYLVRDQRSVVITYPASTKPSAAAKVAQ